MVQIVPIFLEDVQIIHGISLHFFKPHISKICNSFSFYIYIYIYIYELDITDARACLDPQYLINFKLNTLNAEYT